MSTDPKKPLIVFSEVYTRLYGAQRSMLELYRYWHQTARYRLHFVYHHEGDLSAAIAELGIPYTRLPLGRLLGSFQQKLLHLRWWEYPLLYRELSRYARDLSQLLVDLGADLLYCNNDRVGLMSYQGARRARVPQVTHIRRAQLIGFLDRHIVRKSLEIAWSSQAVRDVFITATPLAASKGTVVFDGRNLADRHQPSTRAELWAEFDFEDDVVAALVIASLAPVKDHETLIRAARIACRAEPRLQILLAGVDPTPDGVRRRELDRMIHEAGIDGRIRFLGHRDDVGRLLRGVDLVIQSSVSEALPGSMVEAQGYGVPCVATDAGGTREVLPDGKCGYLVPVSDHEALADKTLELVRDPDLRERFSAAARANFEEVFTMEQCGRRTAAFFDRVIGLGSGASAPATRTARLQQADSRP